MKQGLPRFFFLRAAFPVGMLAVVAVTMVVMSGAKPAPVSLRSSLASLPVSLGSWSRATDDRGVEIGDTVFNPEMIEAIGTQHALDRRYESNGRTVRASVVYYTGNDIDEVPMLPERAWDSAGVTLVSPVTVVRLSSGHEVKLSEFGQGPSGHRIFAAYTYLCDGKPSVDPDAPRVARSHWTKVQLDARFPSEEAATARQVFLADVEDLMPRVVSELQDTCLPLPVPAVPTG